MKEQGPIARVKPDQPYELVRRDTYADYRDNTRCRVVRVGDATFGEGFPTMIAGPCAVESREQTLAIARAVKAAGAEMLRGGAFKPRTSPYEFQGLGDEGLEILAEARAVTGLPVVTEVLDPRDVERIGQVADCLQVGARSMQNFALLSEVGRSGLPVLLKRHWAATLLEWLCAAEYIAVEGNLDIILCERGIRTFTQGDYNRNTLDLNVIPAVRERSILPIVADPSHGTGVASMVPASALAALGAGADGLIIEVLAADSHRECTLCDGPQGILPAELESIVAASRERRPRQAAGAGEPVMGNGGRLPCACWAAGLAMVVACAAPPDDLDERSSLGAGLPPVGEQPFLDVTAAAGIGFRHQVGDGLMDNIIESLGSGAVWFDADGDRDLDLYLINQGWREGVSGGEQGDAPGNRLYLNRGDGTFADGTRDAGVGDAGYGYSAAVGDIDNDGDADLYVANCGANRLYVNRGDGTFRERAATAGVADPRCSAGATFLDADGDGSLDLYVANYLTFDPEYTLHYAPDVYPGPLAYAAEADALYRNRGDGSFDDWSERSGVAALVPGRAMGVVAADFDLDGRQDVFVANDASENFLMHNAGGGVFEERAVVSGVAYGIYGEATGAMAGSVGDLDGDGLPDILVTDTTYGSLYRNTPDGLFEDLVVASGLAAPSGQWVSWGGGFFDFDNDGRMDVLLVNGDLKHPTGRPDLLLANTGGGAFEVADGGDYFGSARLGRGGAFADFDDDGDLDVLVTNLDDAPVLLRNDWPRRGHWLRLRLVGTATNRDGLGARITVEAGGRRWTRVHHAAAGYLTQGDPREHFGLGEATVVDRLEVVWPDGASQIFEGLAADQPYTVTESGGIE